MQKLTWDGILLLAGNIKVHALDNVTEGNTGYSCGAEGEPAGIPYAPGVLCPI